MRLNYLHESQKKTCEHAIVKQNIYVNSICLLIKVTVILRKKKLVHDREPMLLFMLK